MREHRGNWRVGGLAAVALVAAMGSEGGFDVAGGGASIGREAWMPDVGPRIAELKARATAAAAQARSRRASVKSSGGSAGDSAETLGGQWWRFVAAKPADGAQR